MRIVYRFVLCLLMALFAHETYLVGFCDAEPSTDIITLSLVLSFLVLFEKLMISITIEQIQIAIAKAKVKKND